MAAVAAAVARGEATPGEGVELSKMAEAHIRVLDASYSARVWREKHGGG